MIMGVFQRHNQSPLLPGLENPGYWVATLSRSGLLLPRLENPGLRGSHRSDQRRDHLRGTSPQRSGRAAAFPHRSALLQRGQVDHRDARHGGTGKCILHRPPVRGRYDSDGATMLCGLHRHGVRYCETHGENIARTGRSAHFHCPSRLQGRPDEGCEETFLALEDFYAPLHRARPPGDPTGAVNAAGREILRLYGEVPGRPDPQRSQADRVTPSPASSNRREMKKPSGEIGRA